MPALPDIRWLKPTDWKEFENMVHDAMEQQWEVTLQKNGRPGQKQNGIDIYGPDYIERPTGIQCKNSAKKITETVIQEELKKAKTFKGNLNTIFIATTTDNDAKLQTYTRIISKERIDRGESAVGLLFWEDIIRGLQKNINFFKRYFPFVQLANSDSPTRTNTSTVLDLGFYSALLKDYAEQIGHHEGVSEELKTILFMILHKGKNIFPKELYEQINPITKHIWAVISNKEMFWHNSEISDLKYRCKNLEMWIEQAHHYLPDRESHIFDFGRILGKYYVGTTHPSNTILNDLTSKYKFIFPDGNKDIADELSIIADEASKDISQIFYKWPIKLYRITRKSLWWESN